MTEESLLALTARIVTAHLAINWVAAADLPALVRNVHAALAGLGRSPAPAAAVSIPQSLADPGHILSMIDGRPYKSLKRHLSRHGLTPDAYRTAFGLPVDYPMTAPAYSESRRALAARTGFGHRNRGRRNRATG